MKLKSILTSIIGLTLFQTTINAQEWDDPISTSDWNTLWRSSFVESYNASNSPESGQWFWGINLNHSSNSPSYRYNGQIAIKNAVNNPTMYFRSTDVNGFGIWAKVLNSYGDQSISGKFTAGTLSSGSSIETSKTSFTKFQVARHDWSGSHALLFNAYADHSVNGSLGTVGNTKYANDVGSFSGGAGAIMFFGNGGTMDFLISPTSSGEGTNVDWGLPKMRILRDGNVGIGTSIPDSKLHIQGSGDQSIKLWSDDAKSQIHFRKHNTGNDGMIIYHTDGRMSFNLDGTNAGGVTSNEFMTIKNSGSVGIGTATPSEKLEVNGTIRSKEVKVEASPWPDYVFEEDYNLRSLEETEAYIDEHGHLPELPSAAEVQEEGIKVGEMNTLLLKKIEELTLHQIEMMKIIKKQQEEIEQLKKS